MKKVTSKKIEGESSFEEEAYEYTSAKVIGIDFTNNLTNVYVDDGLFSQGIEYSNEVTNVEAIFHKADDNKKCRVYAYKLMNASKDWSGKEEAYLSNNIVVNYLDYESTFQVLQYIFIACSIVFLCVGIFITYKQILSSILKNEKDLGVLKSMGVTSIDIFRILNIQNLIIIVISVILGCILQYGGVYVINKVTSLLFHEDFKSYYVTIWNYLTIILVSIIVPIVVSMYPTIKCSRKSPKDILNNN